MKKKAQINSSWGVFQWMIMGFLTVLIFAGWIYISGTLNTVFHQVGLAQPTPINVTFPCINNASETCGGTFAANFTKAADVVWQENYDAIKALRMVSLVYLLAYAMAIILVGVLEKKHPILFFAYILFCALAIYFSAPISNAYLTLLNSGVFGGELTNFTASNWILLNLPIVVLVISFCSIIGLFFNLIRNQNEGGNI